MEDEPLLLHRRDERGVVTLTLNRPGAFNALSEAMLSALGEAFDALAADDRVRAVARSRIRLAGDGLVVTLPNRTTIVAPVDIARFPQYVDALDLAQRINTRLAAELRSEQDLRDIAAAQQGFIVAVKSKDHLAMSEANKNFHMAIARAGRNAYFAAFYEKLLDEGRRILHLHFDYIEKTNDGRLLTDEHEEMIAAISARDVAGADRLAHDHTLDEHYP